MGKKLSEATLDEATALLNQHVLEQKTISVSIADLKSRLNRLMLEKKGIKNQKASRLKILQQSIKKATLKSSKESRKKEKERESKSFDNRLATKDREIQAVKNEILDYNKRHLQIGVVIEKVRQHISSIK